MLPFKRILCPTDFSEPAFTALKRAEELARPFCGGINRGACRADVTEPPFVPGPASVLQFYVPMYQQELAIKAEHMLKDLVSHHKVGTRDMVTTGEAAPEILRIAHEEHVDLIVIASHGLTGWRRLVFGSVTEKVMRQATCPILTIVPPPEVEK